LEGKEKMKCCGNCKYFKPDSNTEGYGYCIDGDFGEETDYCEFYKESEGNTK